MSTRTRRGCVERGALRPTKSVSRSSSQVYERADSKGSQRRLIVAPAWNGSTGRPNKWTLHRRPVVVRSIVSSARSWRLERAPCGAPPAIGRGTRRSASVGLPYPRSALSRRKCDGRRSRAEHPVSPRPSRLSLTAGWRRSGRSGTDERPPVLRDGVDRAEELSDRGDEGDLRWLAGGLQSLVV